MLICTVHLTVCSCHLTYAFQSESTLYICSQLKGGKFVFHYVQLLYYECHKINPKCGGSYIDSPYWMKYKNATKNPINEKDNKCFEYAAIPALNYEEIKKDPQRITNTNK